MKATAFPYPLLVCLYILLLGSLCSCNGPIQTDTPAPGPPSGINPENQPLRPRSSLLSVGSSAPFFVLYDQKERPVSAAELSAGKGAVIIFLPADTNPAVRPAYQWTRQNRNLLAGRGLEIILITPHNPPQNDSIAAREELRVALLFDPASWVSAAHGAASGNGEPPRALTSYVIGSNGRIQLATRGLPESSDVIIAAESLPGQEEESLFSPF